MHESNSYAKIDKEKLISFCKDFIEIIEKHQKDKNEEILSDFIEKYNKRWYRRKKNITRDQAHKKIITSSMYSWMYYPCHDYDNQKKLAEKILNLCNCSIEDTVNVTAEDLNFIHYKEND